MSRRRKRRSRKKHDQLQSSNRTSSAGANFLSFILGMATTVMLCLLGYNTINASYAQAAVAPTAATNNHLSSGEAYDEVTALLDSGNIPEVVAKLADLNAWPKTAELPIRVSANRNREKVAKKLLRMNGLNEADRVFAIDSLIEALAAIYGLDYFYNLGDGQVGDQLKEVAQSHLNDTNAQVIRAAQLASLKYHAFEYLKLKKPTDESYQALEHSLFRVLDNDPNDTYSLSNVKLIFKSMNRFKPDLSVKLTRLLLEKRKDYAGTKVDQLVADLADTSLLLETRYAAMFENRWVNGEAGREQLLRISLKLISDKSAGRSVIVKVDQVAQWFEQQNRLDRASEIYQAMVDEADRPDNLIAMKTANQLGQDGLIRCDAIGQPAVFSGVDITGRPLSKERFRGRIVAVIFWSLEDADSIKELLQLHQERSWYSSLPADTIAVCIEQTPGTKFSETTDQLKRFTVCDPAKYRSEGIPFTKQVPVTRVPQIMLIDQQGNISDTNVPADNLRSHIEHLASKR